jgi:hypothetical protein
MFKVLPFTDVLPARNKGPVPHILAGDAAAKPKSSILNWTAGLEYEKRSNRTSGLLLQ